MKQFMHSLFIFMDVTAEQPPLPHDSRPVVYLISMHGQQVDAVKKRKETV